MYKNLKAEMARKGITSKELSQKLNMTEGTFSAKFNRKSAFTIDEILLIKKILKLDMTLEELFATEED